MSTIKYRNPKSARKVDEFRDKPVEERKTPVKPPRKVSSKK